MDLNKEKKQYREALAACGYTAQQIKAIVDYTYRPHPASLNCRCMFPELEPKTTVRYLSDDEMPPMADILNHPRLNCISVTERVGEVEKTTDFYFGLEVTEAADDS